MSELQNPRATYGIDALVRDEYSGRRSIQATRTLVELVGEFDEESYLALDCRTGEEQGHLDLSITIEGPASSDLTLADLKYALGDAIEISEATGADAKIPEFGQAMEIVRMPNASAITKSLEDYPTFDTKTEFDRSSSVSFAFPIPNESDSSQALLAAMVRSEQKLWVRTILKAADPLSTQMLMDELQSGVKTQSIPIYSRIPLLARTIVVAQERVPIVVRMALRNRGSGIEVKPISEASALQAWVEPLAALRSYVVASEHAVAITRIPATDRGTAMGIPTRSLEVLDRALDPVPAKTEHSIRLGWATNAFGQKVDVEMDIQDLRRHIYIEGRSGTGKTTVLAQLFNEITRAGFQVIYLDPHGDGAQKAAAHSSKLSESNTLYVRHGDTEHPIRMNLLSENDPEIRERMVSDFVAFIQAILDPNYTGMVGERFKRTFSLISSAAFEIFGPKASVTQVLAMSLTKEALKYLAVAVKERNRDLARRLDRELISLPSDEFNSLISWFTSRLQPFLGTPAIREILGTGEDSIDILQVIESGQNLIIDLDSLGLGDDVSRMLGALWLLKIKAAIGKRSDRNRPVVILVDEAHLYTFGALPGLLAEARKFGFGIVIATQAADNLSQQLARAIEANCNSAISLRIGIATAVATAARLGGWSAMELTRLRDLTAACSLSVGGVPSDPFTLHVDYFERAERAGWDEASIADAAQEAEADSLLKTWEPFAKSKVMDDLAIIRHLRELIGED
ncbi:MAG: type IV secretion system DNA-binding domain-containing protein [Cryobacterium sp.]|nr:type IV secretion system DNA-binding domain-containing protein [Cryobacterium sp.]